MEVNSSPPAKLARRLITKLSLKPPIDVRGLVEAYADLVITKIPIDGVDGISLNLKTFGKRARVILNAENPPTRQRFTLAHELGHILIPWHTGSIVDHVDPTQSHGADNYWEFESEANTFAGELLVPAQWAAELLAGADDLAMLHVQIAQRCEVSLHAAAIRLAQLLPKNIVFAVERAGIVEFSGRSDGTLANALPWGGKFPANVYEYCEKHYSVTAENRRTHWWRLPNSCAIAVTDKRPWREILDSVVAGLGISAADQKELKSSINGVVAYANSVARRSKEYSVDTVVAACMQRLNDRPEFQDIVNHADFKAFLVQKARALVEPTS
ncbi:MAG TPA: ImmA/IrrE family metallo-endopeptidase [Candidatus Paceibacterota bacterium]